MFDVLEEPAAYIFENDEDGGSRFLQNIGNHS
jgi:hypothetical protein